MSRARLRRIILNTLAAMSLSLCVAAIALCGRSYWVADAWGLTTTRKF